MPEIMKIISIFKNILIPPKLLVCCLYDGWRFLSAAHLFDNPMRTKETSRAHLLRSSHSLEKGMALPEPRKGFGKELTADLLDQLECYYSRFKPDELTSSILGIIEALLVFHLRENVEWPDIAKRVCALREQQCESNKEQECGTITITREDISNSLPTKPVEFFKLRRSVRQFTGESIPKSKLVEAIEMAQRSPSVCNRQGVRVRVFTKEEDRKKVLSFQDGNSGFGDRAAAVFVISTELSVFYKNGERNQAFFDGGIFSMSLALALHSLGYGACMLNWAMSPKKDIKFRRTLEIPNSEVVGVLIAAGCLPEKFTVAGSPRRSIEEVAMFVEGIDSLP